MYKLVTMVMYVTCTLLQFQFYFLIFSVVIQTPRVSLLGVVDGNKLLDNMNQCSYLNCVVSG